MYRRPLKSSNWFVFFVMGLPNEYCTSLSPHLQPHIKRHNKRGATANQQNGCCREALLDRINGWAPHRASAGVKRREMAQRALGPMTTMRLPVSCHADCVVTHRDDALKNAEHSTHLVKSLIKLRFLRSIA